MGRSPDSEAPDCRDEAWLDQPVKVGDVALRREVLRGRVGWAVPVTFVEGRSDHITLFRRAGTLMKRPARTSTQDLAESLAADAYEVVDAVWEHTDVLEIAAAERWHWVWPMWSATTREFLCWYVNFQEPLRRSHLGWDTLDLALDTVVARDLSWRWKDEDHFALLQDNGVISADAAEHVRRDADRVIGETEQQRFPFDRDWSDWQPDTKWGLPTLPDGWAELGPLPD
jgi:hypothetical protein